MKNIKIGSRLGIAFSVVLMLLTAIVVISIWRLQSVGRLTDYMVNEAMVKERYVTEFYKSIENNVIRIVAAAKNPDPVQQKFYKDQIGSTIQKNTELLKQIQTSIQDEQGKNILADIGNNRQAILKTNAAIFVEKAAGREAEAQQMVNEVLVPQGQVYLENIQKLADLQREKLFVLSKEVDQLFHRTAALLLGLGCFAIVVGIALGYLITYSITRPLNDAVKVASQVAQGDFEVDFGVESKDEAGQLMAALRKMTGNLSEMAHQIRSKTELITTVSNSIAQENMQLYERTEMQASSLEETAATMEQLTTTVKRNADNAQQANDYAVSASQIASEGRVVVQRVIDTMRSIDDSSTRISEIISVIDGIAFQTNILALNAAVEAARAGEQGRGFAVVASEVRSLAHRSAAAAKEIKTLIDDSVSKVAAGSELVEQAGSTMSNVVSSVKQVTNVVGEISLASLEQSAGIAEVNKAVALMDQGTQQNATLVEAASSAAASLQQHALALAGTVQIFKLNRVTAITVEKSI